MCSLIGAAVKRERGRENTFTVVLKTVELTELEAFHKVLSCVRSLPCAPQLDTNCCFSSLLTPVSNVPSPPPIAAWSRSQTMRFLVVPVVVLALICWTAVSQNQSNEVDLTDRISCHEMSVNSFCSGINYTHFATPNFRNGTEESDIESELLTYTILYTSGCSNALVHLLCGYYKPPCFPDANGKAVRLAPCRELCLYVCRTCEPVLMLRADVSWPEHLNCDQFQPHSENSFCFPGFSELETYQNLALPAIPGTAIPATVQKADSFKGAPEPSTPPPVVPSPAVPCPSNMSGNCTPQVLVHHTPKVTPPLLQSPLYSYTCPTPRRLVVLT